MKLPIISPTNTRKPKAFHYIQDAAHILYQTGATSRLNPEYYTIAQRAYRDAERLPRESTAHVLLVRNNLARANNRHNDDTVYTNIRFVDQIMGWNNGTY